MIRRYWTRIDIKLKSLGARLMALYLLLLLVPILGIGFYGHLYLRNALTQNAIQNGLDEVVVRALTVDTLLSQIHDDILYLGQRVEPAQNTEVALRDPSSELTGLAASHTIYQDIAWLDLDGAVQGGHLSQPLADWAGTAAYSAISDLAPNSIRFIPLPAATNSDEALLIAGARLQSSTLLLVINTAYLLQSTDTNLSSGDWALFIQPNILLTTSDGLLLNELGIEQMEGASGSVQVGDQINLYRSAGPRAEWTLIHSLPRAAIVPDLSGYYTTLIFIIQGGLISVAGLALMAIGRMIEPVYQLENMVEQMRRGVARSPLPQSLPSDEFGNLMSAFDQMATELEQKRRTERALIEQLISAQEEERKLIAYDLHDGLIQELVGARFYLSQLRHVYAEQPGATADSFTQSYEVLTHAIAEGRRIIQGLHPTVLEDLGLEAALTELGKTMGETACWQIHLDIATLDCQPDRATSVTLYRITQEALNNAFKHAGAKQVWLTLEVQGDDLCLIIRDDGSGFDPVPILRNGTRGWGIRTMRERATMLRGTCDIISPNGTGTTIRVTVPFARERVSG